MTRRTPGPTAGEPARRRGTEQPANVPGHADRQRLRELTRVRQLAHAAVARLRSTTITMCRPCSAGDHAQCPLYVVRDDWILSLLSYVTVESPHLPAGPRARCDCAYHQHGWTPAAQPHLPPPRPAPAPRPGHRPPPIPAGADRPGQGRPGAAGVRPGVHWP